MTAEEYGALVTALLGVSLAASAPGWTRVGKVIWPPFSLALLLAALAVAGGAPEIELDTGIVTVVAVTLGGALAAAGGGPVAS